MPDQGETQQSWSESSIWVGPVMDRLLSEWKQTLAYVEKWLTEQTLGSSRDQPEAESQACKLGRKNQNEAQCPKLGPASHQQTYEEKTPCRCSCCDTARCTLYLTLQPWSWQCCHSVTTFVIWEDVDRGPEWTSDWLSWLTGLSPSSSVSWSRLMTRYLYSFSGRLQLCFLTRLIRGSLHK